MRIGCFPSAQTNKVRPLQNEKTPQEIYPVTHPKRSEKHKVSPRITEDHPMSTAYITKPQALLKIHIERYLMNKTITEYEKKYLIKKAMIDYLNNLNISDKKKILRIQNTYNIHENQLVIDVAKSITKKNLSSNRT